jgi:hypothetical protein
VHRNKAQTTWDTMAANRWRFLFIIFLVLTKRPLRWSALTGISRREGSARARNLASTAALAASGSFYSKKRIVA